MFSRRKFMASAAVLSGTAVLPKAAFAAEPADVIIIGAGLSGLNAALILKEQGLRPIVLEASSIVGGRVRTHEGATGKIDVGASQIGRSYARIIDACHKYKLNLIPEDRDLLKFGAYYKGNWVVNETWASNPLNKTVGAEREIPPLMMGGRMLAKYNPFTGVNDWLDPKFAADDISLRDLMKRHNHSEHAIELAALSTPGISIDGTSVVRMWQEETRGIKDRSFGPAIPPGVKGQNPVGEVHTRELVNNLTSTSNIEGGTYRLPVAMAEALGDTVRLNKQVTRIEMTNTSGTVHCADGTSYRGRFIISAIPFTVLRKVAIEGAAGGAAARAIATMPYANTSRLYLTVDQPFWKEDGLPPSFITDGPMGMFWGIDNHQGTGVHRAMIVMISTRASAISKMPSPQAEAFVLAELARLRPASVGKMHINTYKDWGRDPFALGCGFSFAPGQVNAFGRTMNEPWQVMHFAGEHTRRTDYGMEAAMESGERAAIEILTRAG